MLYAHTKHTILIMEKPKDWLYKFPLAQYWYKPILGDSANINLRAHASKCQLKFTGDQYLADLYQNITLSKFQA